MSSSFNITVSLCIRITLVLLLVVYGVKSNPGPRRGEKDRRTMEMINTKQVTSDKSTEEASIQTRDIQQQITFRDQQEGQKEGQKMGQKNRVGSANF